jgi:hypothetical protein
VINETFDNLWGRSHDGEMERRSTGVVSLVGVRVLLAEPVQDIIDISINDGLTKSGRVSNISHISPVLLCQGVERTDLLSARVINKESNLAFDVNLSLFLRNFFFLGSDWFGAEATAIFDHILDAAKECRVTMQVDLSVIGLVPLRIEEEITRVAELLNALCIEMLTIRNGEGMVVGNILLREPISNLILVVVFDISKENISTLVHLRSATLLASLVEICFSGGCCWQSLKDKQTGQAQRPLEASLEDGRINARSIKIGPVDLKVSVRILGEAILVGRTSTSKVNMVDLGDEAAQCSGSYIDLVAIIGAASGVNIETRQDFTDGLVDSQDNLK